jgi:2-oxoglutarate dehydrogenase E2 component (dihydrolipoamide succinyltransferase)
VDRAGLTTPADLVGPAEAHPAEADLVSRAAEVDQAAHPAAADPAAAAADPAAAEVDQAAHPAAAAPAAPAEAAADATISARGADRQPAGPQRRQQSSLANSGLPSRNYPPPSGHSSSGVIGWVCAGECETRPTEKG